MRENPDFHEWMSGHYLPRYPSPPRQVSPLTAEEVQGHGFCVAARDSYSNYVAFSPSKLADYLLTQSNVIAAVEQGKEHIDNARAWITSSIAPLFLTPNGTFEFGGDIAFLTRRNEGLGRATGPCGIRLNSGGRG